MLCGWRIKMKILAEQRQLVAELDAEAVEAVRSLAPAFRRENRAHLQSRLESHLN